MKSFGILLIASLGAVAQAGSLNFTFDNDNQGWTRGNLGNTYANITTNQSNATWAGGGETGGYIAGIDHTSYAFHFSADLAPASADGDYGDLFGRQISFDFQSTATGGEDPLMILMSSTDFIIVERTVIAGSSFTNWAFTLDDSTNWYFNSSDYHNGANAVFANNAQIQGVLDDLRYVGISTDIGSGGDNTRLDNLIADPVPEPATMTVLGLAALAALRKKRKA